MKKTPDFKILDDIARVAGGAVNVLSGLQQQIQADVKSRVEEMASRLDLVPREDLERAEARIAKLEKAVALLMDAKPAMPRATPAPKKAAPTASKPAASKKKKARKDA